MDWIQVGLGILAGIIYSLAGWLRNRVQWSKDLPKEGEIAKAILKVKDDPKEASRIASAIWIFLIGRASEIKKCFNKREFLVTVAQGLVIGLFIGGLGLPLDVSISLATQLGLLTLVRKIIGMIKV